MPAPAFTIEALEPASCLLQAAHDWALQETQLDWIDLEVLTSNLPARGLVAGPWRPLSASPYRAFASRPTV